MDRVLVQTGEPTPEQVTAWKKLKPTRVMKAEIEIPDVTIVDSYVHVHAEEVG
jgi:hypothetical protein